MVGHGWAGACHKQNINLPQYTHPFRKKLWNFLPTILDLSFAPCKGYRHDRGWLHCHPRPGWKVLIYSVDVLSYQVRLDIRLHELVKRWSKVKSLVLSFEPTDPFHLLIYPLRLGHILWPHTILWKILWCHTYSSSFDIYSFLTQGSSWPPSARDTVPQAAWGCTGARDLNPLTWAGCF